MYHKTSLVKVPDLNSGLGSIHQRYWPNRRLKLAILCITVKT